MAMNLLRTCAQPALHDVSERSLGWPPTPFKYTDAACRPIWCNMAEQCLQVRSINYRHTSQKSAERSALIGLSNFLNLVRPNAYRGVGKRALPMARAVSLDRVI